MELEEAVTQVLNSKDPQKLLQFKDQKMMGHDTKADGSDYHLPHINSTQLIMSPVDSHDFPSRYMKIKQIKTRRKSNIQDANRKSHNNTQQILSV